MKNIKADTFYKTTSGSKSYVGYLKDGWAYGHNGEIALRWNQVGVCFRVEDGLDLISEWKEREPDVDIGGCYYRAYKHSTGDYWVVDGVAYPSINIALDHAPLRLLRGGEYGVLKVGTTIITDIKVKE
jgi:hypothetical protein